MNNYPGVVGIKVGMTQLMAADGTVTPCTVIEALPVVVGKRTEAVDGYDALMLGIGEAKAKGLTKPVAGFFKKNGVDATKTVRELRCSAEHAASFEVGQKIDLSKIFDEGQMVDVQGVSRGRGFTGVMRRHNFHGTGRSHGAHEVHRHGGSIGTNMTPGRVLPGKKMAGQHGNSTTSVLNQRIAKLMADDGLIFIRGAVPGSKNGLVMVRGAVRKDGGKAKA